MVMMLQELNVFKIMKQKLNRGLKRDSRMLKSACKILKDNKCKKVLFAGKVNKPNFSKLKLDFKGIYYIPLPELVRWQ